MSDPRYPGPSAKDYALLVVSLVFVAMGLVILPSKFDVGIIVTVFFGACGAIGAATILRKERQNQAGPLVAKVAGGVPIRPSRIRLMIMSLGVLFLGAILVGFAKSLNLVIWYIGWFMAAVGGGLLLGTVVGIVPAGFLRFDPEGLTFFFRGWGYTVSWDNIEEVAAGEYQNNPCAFIWLVEPGGAVPRPEGCRPKMLHQFDFCMRHMGAHVFVMTSAYGIDLPVFMAALERYRSDPAARAELAQPLALSDGPGN